MRKFLYRLARLLGDVNAASKGRFHKRYARKQVYKAFGKRAQKLFR